MAIDCKTDTFFCEIEEGSKKARVIMNDLLESHFYHEDNSPTIKFMSESVYKGDDLIAGSAIFNTLEWVHCYENIMTKLLIINDYVVQVNDAMRKISEVEKAEAEARAAARMGATV